MDQNSIERICSDLHDSSNILDTVFNKVSENDLNFKYRRNFGLLPTNIFSLLLLINLLTPSIVEVTRCKHANVISFFRSIFCVELFLALLSWMFYSKSLIIGISAASLWQNYFLPFFAVRISQDKHRTLWIITQISTLFVNLSIFILSTNAEILENSGYLICFLLCAKCSVGSFKIFLFRIPLTYLQKSKNKTLKIATYLLNILPKEVPVFFLLLSFTFVECLLLLHYKDVHISFSARDMTLTSTTAFLMIIGHTLADIIKHKFKTKIASLVVSQICNGYVALIIIAEYIYYQDFLLSRSTLGLSTILFGFSDACYSQNNHLTMVFTDKSAEVFALIKFTQILITGLVLTRNRTKPATAAALFGIFIFAGLMSYYDSFKPIELQIQTCEL